MSPHLEGTQQIGLLLLADGMGVGSDVRGHTLTTSECERLCFCVYWKYDFIPITWSAGSEYEDGAMTVLVHSRPFSLPESTSKIKYSDSALVNEDFEVAHLFLCDKS